jgi:hypothetical protein
MNTLLTAHSWKRWAMAGIGSLGLCACSSDNSGVSTMPPSTETTLAPPSSTVRPTAAVTTLATTTTLAAPTDCIYIVQSLDNLTKIKDKINATQQPVPNPPYTLNEIKAANPQFGNNFDSIKPNDRVDSCPRNNINDVPVSSTVATTSTEATSDTVTLPTEPNTTIYTETTLDPNAPTTIAEPATPTTLSDPFTVAQKVPAPKIPSSTPASAVLGI